MTNFNDLIHNSARRIAKKQNASLHVPNNPLERHTYWGWVATPAAALAGVVAGLSLSLMTSEGEQVMTQVTDTIFMDRNLLDTIYLTKVETENIVRHDTIYLPAPAATTTDHAPHKEPTAAMPRVAQTTIHKPSARPTTTPADTMTDEPQTASSHRDDVQCTSIQCDGINYSMLINY